MDKLNILLGISLTLNLFLIGLLIFSRRLYKAMNYAWRSILEDLLKAAMEEDEDLDNCDN